MVNSNLKAGEHKTTAQRCLTPAYMILFPRCSERDQIIIHWNFQSTLNKLDSLGQDKWFSLEPERRTACWHFFAGHVCHKGCLWSCHSKQRDLWMLNSDRGEHRAISTGPRGMLHPGCCRKIRDKVSFGQHSENTKKKQFLAIGKATTTNAHPQPLFGRFSSTSSVSNTW